MSDLPHPDRDPDPAALDELQRAFADDRGEADDHDPSAGAAADGSPGAVAGADLEADRVTDVVSVVEQVDPPVSEHDRAGVGSAAGSVDSSDPEADRVTDVVSVVEQVDPPVSEHDRAGVGSAAGSVDSSDPEADRVTDVVSAVEQVDVRTGGDRAADDEGAGAPEAEPDAEVPTPPEVVALEGDDESDSTDPPLDGGPVDLVIVEQEPAAAVADGADDAEPSMIQIDDSAESTVVDDSTPESLADTAAPVPPVPPGDAGGSDADGVGVITISDDELPDPVYVEGSLDADGSGTIVFIEDDDTGDVLGPDSERDLRRGIEPRLRERRVAVKRAQGRRRLKRVGIVVGVIVLIVGVLAVLGSPLFAVREGDVEVFGARYADEEQLQAIIDDAIGTPVLRLDTDQVEADIEAIPWVDEASVTTDFPHGLVIDIREREAWTTYLGPDGRHRVLDREGRVLDVLDMYPFAYVLIVGPDPVDLDAGEFAPQGYVAASELAKNLTGAMRGRVTQIEVTADGSRLVVHLDDGSTVMFGEARDLLAKLVRLEAVLTNGQEREPGLIDVSTADVTR